VSVFQFSIKDQRFSKGMNNSQGINMIHIAEMEWIRHWKCNVLGASQGGLHPLWS